MVAAQSRSLRVERRAAMFGMCMKTSLIIVAAARPPDTADG
jgi:hypothetical protein